MPLTYNGSLHMITSANPPVVVGLPNPDTWRGDHVDTEVISQGAEAVQWRYGIMRGGTNAVFDAGLGGYVLFFHSSVNHHANGTVDCHGRKRTYYVGCAVLAAEPPFAIQQMTLEPLACTGMYTEEHGQKGWWAVFPLGLIIEPEGDLIVSYGRNDNSTRVIRFDRARLAEALQPPLPAAWDGDLITSCR